MTIIGREAGRILSVGAVFLPMIPMAITRYRLRFSKREALRFISHHDLMRSFELALRRSKLPIAFTQGFNPHPKVSFALALPLGVESLDEIVDIDLEHPEGEEPLETQTVMEKLGKEVPSGMKFLSCLVAQKRPTVAAAIYQVDLTDTDTDLQQLQTRLNNFLNADEFTFSRPRGPRKPPRVFDAQKFVDSASLEESTLVMRLALTQEGGMKPSDLLQILELDPLSLLVTKVRTILTEEQTAETESNGSKNFNECR